ncbi:sororin [Trichomycterus rosablanca]|uniref:sororin n=1 Tax=Trichomycterus rosablanca TaxID=2290929 RepID=UPI002F35DB82
MSSSRTPRPVSSGQGSKNNNISKTNGSSPPQRKSARLSGNEENLPPKIEVPSVPVKRSILVRKIAPRKTQITSEPTNENEERSSIVGRKRSKGSSPKQAETTTSKPTVLSPIQSPAPPLSRSSSGRKRSKGSSPKQVETATSKPTILSPIQPPSSLPPRSSSGRKRSKGSSPKQAETTTPKPTILSPIQPPSSLPPRSSSGRKRSKGSSPKQAETTTPKPTILSPIQPPASPPPRPIEPEQDPVWSNKVRRSYSRSSMNDRSFESPKPQSASSPSRRETLFGFEKLQTPEVIRKADVSKGASSSIGVGSFNLSAANDSVCNTPEPDLNIPGVCLVKKNTRRKRVQQIKMSELDVLAAQMNAEFEEAECFELVVE